MCAFATLGVKDDDLLEAVRGEDGGGGEGAAVVAAAHVVARAGGHVSALRTLLGASPKAGVAVDAEGRAAVHVAAE